MIAVRRLAVTLVADVDDYLPVIGEDVAETAKAVRERRKAATPIVGSFGGALVKTMGDGVIPEFSSMSPPTNVRPFASTRRHPGGG